MNLLKFKKFEHQSTGRKWTVQLVVMTKSNLVAFQIYSGHFLNYLEISNE